MGSVLLSPGSVQKSSACLGHQYSYKLLHCSFFQCYPAGVLFCAAYYLGQVGFPVSSAEFKPSEKLSTDGVHLRYRIPVQFKGRLGLVRPASNLQVVSPSPAAPEAATSFSGRCGRGLSLGIPGGRPPPRSCIPPFRCNLTAHLAPGAVVGPWRPDVAG